MTPKKRAMLAALEKSLGIVTTASRVADVSRESHYKWLEEDAEYKEAVRLIGEQTIDFAESHLHKLIKSENPAAVIFFLKTKGKGRGYIERQEIAVEESRPLSWFKE